MRALLLILLVGCGSSTPPASTPANPVTACGAIVHDENVIYGTVTDARTHAPLVGATVVVDEELPDTDEARQAYEPGLTNADGCYALIANRTGKITIVAYYADRAQRTIVEHTTSKPLQVDLAIVVPNDGPSAD